MDDKLIQALLDGMRPITIVPDEIGSYLCYGEYDGEGWINVLKFDGLWHDEGATDSPDDDYGNVGLMKYYPANLDK